MLKEDLSSNITESRFLIDLKMSPFISMSLSFPEAILINCRSLRIRQENITIGIISEAEARFIIDPIMPNFSKDSDVIMYPKV